MHRQARDPVSAWWRAALTGLRAKVRAQSRGGHTAAARGPAPRGQPFLLCREEGGTRRSRAALQRVLSSDTQPWSLSPKQRVTRPRAGGGSSLKGRPA